MESDIEPGQLEQLRLEVVSAFQFLLDMSFEVQCQDVKGDPFFSPYFIISLLGQMGKRKVAVSYARDRRGHALVPETLGVIIFAKDRGSASISVDNYIVSKHPSDKSKIALDPGIAAFRERVKRVLVYFAQVLSGELRPVVEGYDWIDGYGIYMS